MKLFNIAICLLASAALSFLSVLSTASAQSLHIQQAEGGPAAIVSKTGETLILGSASTDGIRFKVNGTTIGDVTATGITLGAGLGFNVPVYVPTFAATPAAGTNDIKKGFNAIPTAAANTAACLPAVPVAGDVFEGMNTMANAVRVKACGTPGINGAAAGTYLTVAAATYFRCTASSATAYQCGTLAVPTPAGP